MLDSCQMPPPESEQPDSEERQRLSEWLEYFLTSEAEARAGDPGPVVLRRLSNAEYTYTIRDLTGIPSLDPAREFPTDGAAGEGFANTGAALVMSPALLTKYFDAAKKIVAHAVLLPDGIEFSEATTRRDWTTEKLDAIRDFYRHYAATGVDTAHNLQGVVVNDDVGGVIPLERYLHATVANRQLLQASPEAIAEVARQQGLSPKYLAALWSALNDSQSSLLLDKIRSQWQTAELADVGTIVEMIEQWQKALWHFSKVGQIGKRDGPAAWQIPVSPLANSFEVSLELPDTVGDDVTLYLTAGDAGDREEQDVVVWKNARLAFQDGTELPLNELESADLPTTDIAQSAPSTLSFRIPERKAAAAKFLSTVVMHPERGKEGSIQVMASAEPPDHPLRLTPGVVVPVPGANPQHWTAGAVPVQSDMPIIVAQGSDTSRRLAQDIEQFQQLFPAALSYNKIVPVDEVITMTLFYREDDHLQRLMLDEQEIQELNRLWEDFHFVSQDALQQLEVFEEVWQYATQDADPTAFELMREPFRQRAERFRKELEDAESAQLEAMLDFVARAWRRRLSTAEREKLMETYRDLREEKLDHDQALRFTLARALIAPEFLYKVERPGPGAEPTPISDIELATRLSYFLWSSLPDEQLLAVVDRLSDDEVLISQTKRMLEDPRTRRLAEHFACQWLHVRNFDRNDDKNEALYPEFPELRKDMYEETVLFFEDMFRHDGSILDVLDADHTFLNEALARHYDIDWEDITGGLALAEAPTWIRAEGMQSLGRGGVLGMATVLASQSGASRTSAILRGNWVYETLLGERLPRPPANVPQLPDEVTPGLTARQLIESHSSEPACAKCHLKIDPYGFALEQFDAIGRPRPEQVNTKTALENGEVIDGIQGLRDYLISDRCDDIIRQFCRKLLGYALGREVQLSDEPLLDEMQSRLAANDYRFHVAVEAIVTSPQFRNIRGKDAVDEGLTTLMR